MAGWDGADPFSCQETAHRHRIYNPRHAAWAVSLCSKYWLLQPAWQGKTPTNPLSPFLPAHQSPKSRDIDLYVWANNHMAAMPFRLIRIHGAASPGCWRWRELNFARSAVKDRGWRPEFCSLSGKIDPDGRDRTEMLCMARHRHLFLPEFEVWWLAVRLLGSVSFISSILQWASLSFFL